MTFDLCKLREQMDKVREDPAFAPAEGVTFCNLATFRLLQNLGFPHFWNEKKERPMVANECVDFCEGNPDKFSKFYNPAKAHALANLGHLVLAAIKDMPHGHIAPIYPVMESVTSGKWPGQKIPKVSNVGEENKVMGLNYAFRDMPNFYLVI